MFRVGNLHAFLQTCLLRYRHLYPHWSRRMCPRVSRLKYHLLRPRMFRLGVPHPLQPVHPRGYLLLNRLKHHLRYLLRYLLGCRQINHRKCHLLHHRLYPHGFRRFYLHRILRQCLHHFHHRHLHRILHRFLQALLLGNLPHSHQPNRLQRHLVCLLDSLPANLHLIQLNRQARQHLVLHIYLR